MNHFVLQATSDVAQLAKELCASLKKGCIDLGGASKNAPSAHLETFAQAVTSMKDADQVKFQDVKAQKHRHPVLHVDKIAKFARPAMKQTCTEKGV